MLISHCEASQHQPALDPKQHPVLTTRFVEGPSNMWRLEPCHMFTTPGDYIYIYQHPTSPATISETCCSVSLEPERPLLWSTIQMYGSASQEDRGHVWVPGNDRPEKVLQTNYLEELLPKNQALLHNAKPTPTEKRPPRPKTRQSALPLPGRLRGLGHLPRLDVTGAVTADRGVFHVDRSGVIHVVCRATEKANAQTANGSATLSATQRGEPRDVVSACGRNAKETMTWMGHGWG